MRVGTDLAEFVEPYTKEWYVDLPTFVSCNSPGVHTEVLQGGF